MRQTSLALALASLSFMLTLIWGTPVLRILRHYRIGEKMPVVRNQQKSIQPGTPSLGGILFIAPVALVTILLNAVSLIGLSVLGRSVLLPLGTMVGFAGLGSIGDLKQIWKDRFGWFRIRTKLIAQYMMGLIVAFVLWRALDVPEMFLPFYEGEFELKMWFVLIATFVIVGTLNAISLTDGVQGLSGMLAAISFVAYGIIAIFQGQIFVTRFCFTVTGALLGFLWFNIKPASLVMGHTGSYALGATLAVVAFMTGQWPLLPLIAFIPMVEVLSVILQLSYFRLSGGRRLFRMVPLHHHYELGGWSETQIIQRFWLINLLFAMIGVTLALV